VEGGKVPVNYNINMHIIGMRVCILLV